MGWWSKSIPGGARRALHSREAHAGSRTSHVVVVDCVFNGLELFPEALAYLAEGRHLSKIARMIT